MNTPLFLRNKVERQLKTNGLDYSFTKMGEDDYHQPIETDQKVSIRGIYHESNSFITLSSSDAASIQKKKSPMILCLMDENVKLLSQGDRVTINEVTYRISGILDIQNYSVVADISLEMEV